MITAEEAQLGVPARSYRVGVVAGMPGLVMLPLVLWMLWVRVIDGPLASSRSRWVAGIAYLASLVWILLGPFFLGVVFLAAVSVSRSGDAQRASTLRALAWASLASWILLVGPMLLAFAGVF